MKNLKVINGLSFLLALMLFNCKSPSNLLEDGYYDEAVYKAVMNLQKKKVKKEKDILVVEEAFRKITADDMAEIESLMASPEPVKWVKINKLHNQIKERQELIEPHLPLISTKTHYKADFRFVRIAPLELDSRKKAAEYYYAAGTDMLEKAEAGDKNAARNAYRKFNTVQAYFPTYKDAVELGNTAQELGIDKVLFEMRNVSYGYNPFFAGQELMNFDERSLNDTWTRYYNIHNAPQDIDLRVEVDVTEMSVAPEFVEYNNYRQSKKLFKTVKVPVTKTITTNETPRGDRGGNNGGNRGGERGGDRGGNNGGLGPVSTSNTNTTVLTANPKPRTKVVMVNKKVPFTVHARVRDTRITKSAFVGVNVKFIDARTGRILSSENIGIEENFLSFTSTFKGDRRALTHAVVCRLNNNIAIVPRDGEMLSSAAYKMKDKIRHFVRAEDSYVSL